MEKSTQALETALRVLNAVTVGCIPNQADVDELRHLAPLLADGPVDELACNVIQQAVRRREEAGKPKVYIKTA